MSSEVQAILFNKNNFSKSKANAKMKEFEIKHGFRPIKDMHETKGFYRYRIQPPGKYERSYTKEIHPGIEFIFGVKKI